MEAPCGKSWRGFVRRCDSPPFRPTIPMLGGASAAFGRPARFRVAPFTAVMVLLISNQLGEGPIESGLYRCHGMIVVKGRGWRDIIQLSRDHPDTAERCEGLLRDLGVPKCCRTSNSGSMPTSSHARRTLAALAARLRRAGRVFIRPLGKWHPRPLDARATPPTAFSAWRS